MKKVYVIASLFAITTAVLIYLFSQHLEEISKAAEVPRDNVVVAGVNVPANTRITEEMLIVTNLPKEAILSGTVKTAAELVGTVARQGIPKGQQILLSQTAKKGDADKLSYELEPDRRAMSIDVSTAVGVAGYIRAGDRVSVLCTETNSETQKTETKVIARNLPVLRISVSASTGSVEYSNITLSVTEEQAVMLTDRGIAGIFRLLLEPTFEENGNE